MVQIQPYFSGADSSISFAKANHYRISPTPKNSGNLFETKDFIVEHILITF